MKPLSLLAALLLTASAGACATVPPSASDLARLKRNVVMSGVGQGRSSYGLFLAGEAALKGGRAEEAAALFARAQAGAPGNATLRARAFTAALSGGEVERAARLAAELTAADGQTAELGRVTRAVDLLARNRARDALVLLGQTGNEPPHGLAAEMLKPWAAAAAGDAAAALAEGPPPRSSPGPLGTPGAAGPGALPTAQLAATLNQGGRLSLLERAGRFAEADALVKAGDGQEGASPRQVLKHGGYLERRGRPAEAAVLYETALARTPTHRGLRAALTRARAGRAAPALPPVRTDAAEALLVPAVAFAGGRQYETATAYARLALHLAPQLDDASVLLGEILAAAGDTEGARRVLLAVKPQSDAFAGSRARLAVVLHQEGRTAEALETIRAAAVAAPEEPAVLTAYAGLLSEAGRHAEAAAVFDPALASEAGRRDWRLWYLRGSALERAGRWPEAEADLRRSLELAPEEPEILNGLGYNWIDRGLRLQEALDMVKRAAALRPRSGAIVDSLGWAHYRLGNIAEAVVHLERAVELEPGDPTINDHLGDAYWRAGRRVEAQFQWTRALSLEPDARVKADATAKLASPLGVDAVRPSAQAAAEIPPVVR
jgi:Flp pilus assembly protein TadD